MSLPAGAFGSNILDDDEHKQLRSFIQWSGNHEQTRSSVRRIPISSWQTSAKGHFILADFKSLPLRHIFGLVSILG